MSHSSFNFSLPYRRMEAGTGRRSHPTPSLTPESGTSLLGTLLYFLIRLTKVPYTPALSVSQSFSLSGNDCNGRSSRIETVPIAWANASVASGRENVYR